MQAFAEGSAGLADSSAGLDEGSEGLARGIMDGQTDGWTKRPVTYRTLSLWSAAQMRIICLMLGLQDTAAYCSILQYGITIFNVGRFLHDFFIKKFNGQFLVSEILCKKILKNLTVSEPLVSLHLDQNL